MSGRAAATSPEDQQRRSTVRAHRGTDLTDEQLWLRYFSLGGSAGLLDVQAYLAELLPLPPVERDLLAHVLNERLDELRASYTAAGARTEPRSRPLTALTTLLEAAGLAPPEQLPVLVADAGRTLGVDVGVYLVDYDQRLLVPLPPPGREVGEPLGVDTTLAGRAFRQVEPVVTEASSPPRLWMPLVDGLERLGVLDVRLPAEDDPYDPVLRAQCRWLARLTGHLVTGLDSYSDVLDAVRRRRPRSVAAELTWQLLPPLTAGTGTFTCTAVLEPTDDVGGDTFDYALSETSADLAIFDAAGHDLGAGVVATAALAAYRNARRSGGSLYDQVRQVDQTVAGRFGGEAFLTGVVAQLDLRTGRLRYVAAGHPYPLLLREGRVVRTLTGGRRPLLGLDVPDVTVGEEFLQPGDWLVLYTDGVVEARDPGGAFFGQQRLVDLLEREAASAHPPPETLRRLVHAVLRHQHGVLQDDATVVLACWAP